MIDDIKTDAEARMKKSLDALQHAFSKIRTGHAHTSLLDHITVSYYGVNTALNRIANVNVEDARTLTVTPWEKNMISVIEKAIMTSDLGLNPNTSGMVIRIPLPPLTEERRKELIRVVRHDTEAARVAIRNIRRDANHDLKELVKEKMASEDEERKGVEDIQKITNTYIEHADKNLAVKEKELLKV